MRRRAIVEYLSGDPWPAAVSENLARDLQDVVNSVPDGVGPALLALQGALGPDLLEHADPLAFQYTKGQAWRVCVSVDDVGYTAWLDEDEIVQVYRHQGGRIDRASFEGGDVTWHVAGPSGDPELN